MFKKAVFAVVAALVLGGSVGASYGPFPPRGPDECGKPGWPPCQLK
ncbi:hypothetical protein [Deinococcus arcticus]|nr:hypothetical protein [Deinococcus arcticus]